MDIQFVDRPEGRIAVEVRGEGPLIVAAPGMGDIRATFRSVADDLVAAGYRVALTDLRGHGDSDAFAEYGDLPTADDLLAVADALGGRAVLLGNSMGASAAVVAAARRPGSVAGLVLLSPFLRERTMSPLGRAAMRMLYRVLFARPWGAAAWTASYRGLIRTGRSDETDAHVAEMSSAMRRPGRLRAFRRLALALDHRVVEPVVRDVRAPAVVIVGTADPDYADPRAEADWMARQLGADLAMVEGGGHYPQLEAPRLVAERALALLATIPRDGADWAAEPCPTASAGA